MLPIGLAASPEDAGAFAPAYDSSVTLTPFEAIDWRWLDVADQAYSTAYQESYTYADATVTISYNSTGYDLIGHISATGLKPHFAYQLKLLGTPYTLSNERIGYRGRWWQEEWNNTIKDWFNGKNLNVKDGSYPSQNDDTYDTNKVITDSNSPSGYKYKHTGYRVFDYVITDANGSVELDFLVNNSYHVLWKTSQRSPTASDGPTINYTFDVNPVSEPAYTTDYGSASVGVFGEWERLPPDNIELLPGDYACEIVLTEESFHDFVNPLAGVWATAMGGNVNFTIWAPAAEPDITVNYSTSEFPRTTLNTSSSLSFSVKNNGTSDLLLLGAEPVTVIGADASYFSVESQPASPVTSASSSAFKVKYTPTTMGTHTVTMRIASNDPDTPDYDIVLTATAARPPSRDDWLDKVEEKAGCRMHSGSGDALSFYIIFGLLMVVCWSGRRVKHLTS